jgi:AcrR family transcriptional regulator
MVTHSETLDREAVVNEAVKLLHEHGVPALTLTALAERLSVTQPALYRHVANVDDLWSAVALRARRDLLERLRDVAVGRSGDAAIDAVAGTWRKFALENAALYKATDLSPLGGDDANEEAARELVAMLSQVAGGYGLDAVEAEQAAWALRSALHGFAVLEAEQGNPASLDLDATFDRLVDLLEGGLQRWASK